MSVAWAGLLAPAAQAQPTQLATGACAEGRLFGAVKPLAVAVLGGLSGGAVGGAGDGEGAAPWAVETPPLPPAAPEGEPGQEGKDEGEMEGGAAAQLQPDPLS